METILTLPTSPFQWAILTILFISLSVEISYYIFYIRSLRKERTKSPIKNKEPLSVIICAKNESTYLEENLPLFLNQDYNDFEVIVVNDGSFDDTETIIAQFQLKYPHLRTTKIPVDDKFHHNKKLAITIGIKAAKNENLIFSSIRSKPSGNTWLKTITESWDKGVLSGYANFENKKGFLHNYLKYDILLKNIKSSSFALSGNPFSGNGNNLGYKKTDFFKNKGFARHAHFESGYDHLMVQQLGKLSGNSVCNHPDAKISLSSNNKKEQWKEINQQYYKCRKYFSFKTKFFIDLEALSKVVFYLIFIYTLFFTDLYLFLAFAFLLRIIFVFSFAKISSSRLKEENLFLSSCIYDIFVLFSRLYFLCTNIIFSKRNQWK